MSLPCVLQNIFDVGFIFSSQNWSLFRDVSSIKFWSCYFDLMDLTLQQKLVMILSFIALFHQLQNLYFILTVVVTLL
eukprot:m.125448 g.125448  ORF g.125448 m.125448 type:complete len:77 (-) comp14495_c0_seq3:2076-2306(-)